MLTFDQLPLYGPWQTAANGLRYRFASEERMQRFICKEAHETLQSVVDDVMALLGRSSWDPTRPDVSPVQFEDDTWPNGSPRQWKDTEREAITAEWAVGVFAQFTSGVPEILRAVLNVCVRLKGRHFKEFSAYRTRHNREFDEEKARVHARLDKMTHQYAQDAADFYQIGYLEGLEEGKRATADVSRVEGIVAALVALGTKTKRAPATAHPLAAARALLRASDHDE
jgi:hypothetical protein